MTTRREFVTALSLAPLALSRESRPSTGFVYDEIYLDHVLHPDHPESPERLRAHPSRNEARGPRPRGHADLEARRAASTYRGPSHRRARRLHPKDRHDGSGGKSRGGRGFGCGLRRVARRGAKRVLRDPAPGHHANNTGDEEGFCFYSNRRDRSEICAVRLRLREDPDHRLGLSPRQRHPEHLL